MEFKQKYPKVRAKLNKEYMEIYEEHYSNNRNGKTTSSYYSQKMERWLHKMVAKDAKVNNSKTTLEIGAGTLNQIPYEDIYIYDIVEPFKLLYQSSEHINKVRNIFNDISEIPKEYKYDRITSVACFEHICNLPEVVENCYKLLEDDGVLRVSIPNEGRFLWKLGYTLTTGLEFKKKYGLDYNVIMKYEHVNTADEIESILKFYFKDVKMKLFGVGKTFSLYRYYECKK